MIVSHEHRFIFIKTMKTASSSMELALSGVCGPDDIITPTREDLDVQRARSGQNYRIDHPAKPKIKWWRRALGRPERHYHPTVGYYEHMPAWRVKAYLGDDIWRSYYKFCFERNPWDRQVSYYRYKTRNDKYPPSFEAFLSDKRGFVVNFDLYTINGSVAVDFVGQYELIDRDFNVALKRIGLESQIALPHVNVTRKDKDNSYRSYYTKNTIDKVARMYEREISLFGYEF